MTQKVPLKSILLNKQSRQDIVDNIMQSYKKQNPAPEVVDTRLHDMQTVLLKYYRQKHADIINMYKNKPVIRKFITTSPSVEYNDSNGIACSLPFNLEQGDDVRLPVAKRCMFVNLNNPDDVAKFPKYVIDVINNNKSKEKSVRKQRAALSAWKVEYERYEQDISNVINGSRSTGQLLNVWPEVEQFLPVGASDPSTINLPSVNINSLNARLGIKK